MLFASKNLKFSSKKPKHYFKFFHYLNKKNKTRKKHKYCNVSFSLRGLFGFIKHGLNWGRDTYISTPTTLQIRCDVNLTKRAETKVLLFRVVYLFIYSMHIIYKTLNN